MMFLGEDLNFWIAMIGALLIKFLLSATRQWKVTAAAMLSGGMAGYYGSKWLVARMDSLTSDDRTVIAIVLVLLGEQLVRAILNIDAETLRKALTRAISGK